MLKTTIIAGSQINKIVKPVPPYGVSRQTIAEYEIKQELPIEVYFMGEVGKVMKSDSLSNLLPLVFDKSVL